MRFSILLLSWRSDMSDPDYAISIQPGYVLVETPPNYDVVWIEQQPMLQAISAACSETGCRKVCLTSAPTGQIEVIV